VRHLHSLLVIYNGANKPVWATGTNGKGVVSLVAQTDGNLVIYDGGHKAKWDTNTDGRVSPGDFDDGDDGSGRRGSRRPSAASSRT